MSYTKGMALIMAIMTAVVLLLISSGLYVVINSNTSITFSGINRTKLYYAAESGASYGREWLKNLKDNYLADTAFARTASNDFNTLNINPKFTFGDISVKIKSSVKIVGTVVEWTMVSTASRGNNGCIITQAGMKPDNALEYTYMTTGALYDNWNVYFTSDQNFYGKTYWGGKIPISVESGNKTATFFGLVETSSNKLSTKGTDNNANYWHFTDPVLDSYARGLNMFGANVNKATTLLDVLNRAFRSGYEYNVPPQALIDMYASWTDVNNTALYPKTYQVGANFSDGAEIYVYFRADSNKVFIGPDFNPANKKVSFVQGTKNIITIPAKFGNVHVKGEVTASVSIVTASDNVLIEGDLFATQYKDFKDLGSNAFDATGLGSGVTSNIEETIADIKAIPSNVSIGLVPGLSSGPAIINFPAVADNMSQTNAVLVTAGMYVKNGKAPAFLGDPSAGDLTASYSSYTNNNPSHLLVFGGFLSKYGEGTTTDGKKGMNPSYAGDPKFLTGVRPPGFKSAVHYDPTTNNPEHGFTDDMTWNVSWY